MSNQGGGSQYQTSYQSPASSNYQQQYAPQQPQPVFAQSPPPNEHYQQSYQQPQPQKQMQAPQQQYQPQQQYNQPQQPQQQYNQPQQPHGYYQGDEPVTPASQYNGQIYNNNNQQPSQRNTYGSGSREPSMAYSARSNQSRNTLYSEYHQKQVKMKLNQSKLGPGNIPFRNGIACVVIGVLFLIAGLTILILMRFQRLTGMSEKEEFIGPMLIVVGFIAFVASSWFFYEARKKSSAYRRRLRYKPYMGTGEGVAVVNPAFARDKTEGQDLASGGRTEQAITAISYQGSMAGTNPRGTMASGYGTQPARGAGISSNPFGPTVADHSQAQKTSRPSSQNSSILGGSYGNIAGGYGGANQPQRISTDSAPQMGSRPSSVHTNASTTSSVGLGIHPAMMAGFSSQHSLNAAPLAQPVSGYAPQTGGGGSRTGTYNSSTGYAPVQPRDTAL